MYKHLKEQYRLSETLFLGTISILCFCFSVFRYVYTDTKAFLFLNWNLFLAFIPWLLSSILIIYPGLQKSKIALSVLIITWLLFFPNAPYILTDLFHLQMKTTMPIWFDLLLILSFAWTGLMFGFMSLWDIEKILSSKINKKIIPFISSLLLFLGSFGIYVGRYLRWNSWDIIREPFALLYDISDNFINPFQHQKTWGMTFFMFLFLTIVYWSFRVVKKRIE
jgi:uncharacterized membrane protein